jgi:hypothetical protein
MPLARLAIAGWRNSGWRSSDPAPNGHVPNIQRSCETSSGNSAQWQRFVVGDGLEQGFAGIGVPVGGAL